MLHGTQVPCKFFFFFLSFLPITKFSKTQVFHWNSIFRVSNRGIWLNSFRTGAFCYLFWAKRANAHFGHYIYIYISVRFDRAVKKSNTATELKTEKIIYLKRKPNQSNKKPTETLKFQLVSVSTISWLVILTPLVA